MKIQTESREESLILTVTGDLNGDSVKRFTETTRRALESGEHHVLLDLSGLNTVDSAGLEALTALQSKCDEGLRMLYLCGADLVLRKVLELTRLDRQFALYDDVNSALAGLLSVAAGVRAAEPART